MRVDLEQETQERVQCPDPARVLHVLGTLGVGGAETLVMNAFRRIDRSRVVFDVIVYSATPEFYDKEFQDLGGRIFRLPYPSLQTLGRYNAELTRILKQRGPFVAVHSHLYYSSGLHLLLARLAGVPVRIAHSHNTAEPRSETISRKCYRTLMKSLIDANATNLVGCSAASGTALFGKQWATANVLRNSIDPDAFPADDRETRGSLRSVLGLDRDDFALAHVGRFDEQKNHGRILEIFAALIRIEPRARLLLIGNGPLRNNMEERCRTMGLQSSVMFLGLRNDVPRVLAACDAFVFPSLFEGLPLVAVEAQLAGLPCVSSEAVPEEADLGLGLLRRLSLADDDKKWAAEILEIARQERPSKQDRERALLRAGFDMRESVRRWESLYLGC